MSPMRVVWRLVCFSPRYFVLCVLFGLVEFVVVPLPLGFATQAFFDALAGDATPLRASSAIVVLVTLEIVSAFASPVFGNPWNSLQQKSHVLLRRNLFAGILRGYGRHGLTESVGDTITRFRDDPDTFGDALDALCDLIGRSVFAVGAAILMWRINAGMTAVLVVPLLLSAYLSEVLGTRTLEYRAAARAATGHVTAFLGELLGAQLALKVAGATNNAVARLAQLGERRRSVAVRDTVFGVLLDSSSVNLIHLGTGLVLLLGAAAIRDGSFSVGDFGLFVVYLDQLAWFPAEIARLISDLKRVDVSYARMRTLVPAEAPSALVAAAPVYLSGTLPSLPAAPPREPLLCLEVRGLSYAYSHGRGIEDVSFKLERGTFTVVTGRIGAGKSTLLQVLLGLLPRCDGDILWNGQPVEDAATFFVPPRSAFTPQVPRLFSTTLRENVLLGREDRDGALRDAVHAAVLEPDIGTLERGLDTPVGPRGVKLSGGQLQRAAAARMFVRDAELMVLDDVSSALDTETEAELWRRLFDRAGDRTYLVVSHRPAARRHADQVLVLDGGRLTTRQP